MILLVSVNPVVTRGFGRIHIMDNTQWDINMSPNVNQKDVDAIMED